MAGGTGSGLRMNEAEISRIIGGRTYLESLKATLNKLRLDPNAGLSIPPAQREQIRKLIQAVSNRTQKKLGIASRAYEQLAVAKTVEKQRKIVNKARREIWSITNKGTGSINEVDDIFKQVPK
jgi:hypothetical protein